LTRYMSVAIRRCEEVSEKCKFLILAAGSDAVVRVFSYVYGDNVDIQRSLEMGEFCQLKTRWLNDTTFLTAATDGLLKIFGEQPFTRAVHQSGVNALDIFGNLVASGGDDQALVVSRILFNKDLQVLHAV